MTRKKSKILEETVREAHPSRSGVQNRIYTLKGQLSELDTFIKRRRESHASELEKLLNDRDELNRKIKELQ